MPDPDFAPLIRRIHNSGKEFVLAFTGGGSGAITSLLKVPGGSKSVLEASVPYSQAALIDLLGSKPEQFCSDRTARAMAMACWLRARKLDQSPNPLHLVGLGCTASLASDRPKKGAHRAFLAIQTALRTATASIELTRDVRTRAEEEDLVAALAVNLIAEAAGLEPLSVPLLPNERIQRDAVDAPDDWSDLFLGEVKGIPYGGAAVRKLIFPGAFNPLHWGHREMAEEASFRLNIPVEYELSIENVDKPPLDYLEIQRRLSRFEKNESVWLTRAPTFVEKSRMFPGATFIVGTDTIVRIGQPRYYNNDSATCESAIREIADNGCRFLVFPRVENVVLQSVDEVELPPSLRKLCDGISPTEFRADISSTQLRNADPEE